MNTLSEQEDQAGRANPVQSIYTLLLNIIDYAGLFPPAKLDMMETVQRYARYRACDINWMLSRLIIPASRLTEFEQAAKPLLSDFDDFWPLSILVNPAGDSDAIKADFDKIEAMQKQLDGQALVESIELRASSSADIEMALEIIPEPEEVQAFFELSLTSDLRGMVAALSGTGHGAKARTGGITPDLFPSPEQLASYIHLCALADVPFKATAGLHHPLRHPSHTVQGAVEFGFFNVFIGAALTKFRGLSANDLATVLDDRTAENFTFTDNEVTWKNHSVSIDELDDCRNNFAISYGSCSFEEPIEDLQQLRLM